jgi:predicted enzyme related to lactoylglutathione lyase
MVPAPVIHFEIGVRDTEKARKFYGPLFGWEFRAHGSAAMVGNLGPMASTPTPGIGGHLMALGHEPHTYCVVYVQVEDLEATLKKAESLGGSRIIPPTEVPGMGHFAWLKDPEGNCVGLWRSMAK